MTIVWKESGGPPAREPPVVGFGSRLLTRTVRHLQRSFGETGLTCQFDMPWLETLGQGPAAAVGEAT